MSLWTELEALFGIATPLIPVIAAENTALHSNASNAALTNLSSAITAAQPLVQAGEIISSSGAAAITGTQKLANAQAAISAAVQIGTAMGIVTQPEAALLPLATTIINAAVAAKNAAPATATTDTPPLVS